MLFYYLLLITCYLDICKIYFKIFCDSKLIVKFIYKGKKKDQNLLFLLASILIYNKLIDTKFVNNVFTHSLLPFKIVNELSQVFKIQALFIQFFFFFWTQAELEVITKKNYMFKLGSFSCWASLRLFTSYLINLLFSYIYYETMTKMFLSLHNSMNF